MAERDVYFVDGLARDRDFLIAISYLHEFDLDPTEFTRIYTCNNGDWEHYESPTQIVSAARTVLNDVPTYFFLARRGEITIIDKDGQREEAIDGPGTGGGKLGYLWQIREIGGSLYACGANRQVYRRDPGAWTAMHDGILDEPFEEVKSSFGSIDGTGSDDLYAAGKWGEIFHFNGKEWTRCDSPTNARLERVLSVAKDEVYICGRRGTFLRGSRDRWDDLSLDDAELNFWGLTMFRGEPHLAHSRGVLRFDGTELVPVEIDLKPAPEFSRLYAVDDVMWCVGEHDILRYDGTKWGRFICPDNA